MSQSSLLVGGDPPSYSGKGDLERGGVREEKKGEYSEVMKIGCLIALWYFLNVMYNVDNKIALTMLPLPWTISCVQLFTGWIFFVFAWVTGLSSRPACHSSEIFIAKIVPQGLCHLFVHIGAVIAFSASAVSFTHIVKAAEPVLTAILSGLVVGQYFAWQTYFSLLPIVFGVGLASATELSFTWTAFWCSMLSNLGSSLRGIFAKQTMIDKASIGINLDSSNIYSLITIVASLASLPMAFIMEGSTMQSVYQNATVGSPPVLDPYTDEVIEAGIPPLYTFSMIAERIFMSGIWYYLYNRVAFGALEKIHQLTHAVANTLKRVVIIIATVVVFQNPVTLIGALGSAIAIGGTFVYSLAKSKYG